MSKGHGVGISMKKGQEEPWQLLFQRESIC